MEISKCFIDVTSLPNDGYGFIQLLFIGGCYGYILMYASNLISDGSELLLLVPSLAGMVGSVVLPVLGAVPDGCIVFFSGMGPNAQEQLSVGIGALAGSTIMLLTVPWFLSIIGGRVNLDNKTGRPNYKAVPKLSPPSNFSLSLTGVALSPLVHLEVYIMLVTCVSYIILQAPGLYYLSGSKVEQAAGEKSFAIIGFFLCLTFFIGYLYSQYKHSAQPDGRYDQARDEFLKNAIATKKVTLLGVMVNEYKEELKEREFGGGDSYVSSPAINGRHSKDEKTPLTSGGGNGSRANTPRAYSSSFSFQDGHTAEFSANYLNRLRKIMKPFFKVYDESKQNVLNIDELRAVLLDLGEVLTKEKVQTLFHRFDKDGNGKIDYEEFVQGTADYIIMNNRELLHKHTSVAALTIAELECGSSVGSDISSDLTKYGGSSSTIVRNMLHDASLRIELTEQKLSGESEEEEEEEELPEDIKDLSPSEQQYRIKMRSATMMATGTLLVLVISDPMVDVLSEIGSRTGIPAFYVSFVLAPLASNACELIAAYNYSMKKTPQSISISLATLLGAAIMNNTFVLGIFMALIVTQSLAWEFLAETLTILIVQLIIGCYALKNTHTLMDGFIIISIYPASLALVALLEAAGWD